MRIERTVIALGLSALLYAQAPGVFDTLEADGDARFNGDVVFTTPSGALVSFQSLVNAGVGLPMTIDSDTSTQGYQCPSGMEEITAARGRCHGWVTPSGTLAGTNGDGLHGYGPARRGGAQTLSISGTAHRVSQPERLAVLQPADDLLQPPTIDNRAQCRVHNHSLTTFSTSGRHCADRIRTFTNGVQNMSAPLQARTTPSASTGSVFLRGGVN